MIPENKMIHIVTRFQDMCLKMYPNDIDTLSPDDRSIRLYNSSLDRRLAQMLTRLIGNDPIQNICRLVQTPRMLKLVLRDSLLTWESLHGEIDFHDILIVNVLKFTAPQAFEFLRESVQIIRGLGSNDRDITERKKSIEDRWTQFARGMTCDSSAAKDLVHFLFPSWKNGSSSSTIKPSPQGVQTSQPTDYWDRLLLGELEEDTVHDQEVLHALRNWILEPGGFYFRNQSIPVALCTNKEFSDKLEQFAPLILDGRQIRQMASSLFAEALRIHGVTADADSVPGFIPLWRRANRQSVDENEHVNWVFHEIEKALQTSLRFANDIYYYWRSNSESDVTIKVYRSDLRTRVIDTVKKLFSHNPDNFIRVLDPNFMYSAYHFCVTHDDPDQGGPGFNPENWIWFADLLIEAGNRRPEVIVPQLVYFVVQQPMSVDIVSRFDSERVEKLFGHNVRGLMAILANDVPLEHYSEREKSAISLANQTAKRWMAAHPHASNSNT